jgi:hypothetical protein
MMRSRYALRRTAADYAAYKATEKWPIPRDHSAAAIFSEVLSHSNKIRVGYLGTSATVRALSPL